MRIQFRSIAWTAALAFAMAPTAGAQITADSAKHAASCRLAAQILTTGNHQPNRMWAIEYIGVCDPSVAGAAAAANMLLLRSTATTEQFQPFVELFRGLRDARMVEAARSIASDPGASVPARVQSFAVLIVAERHDFLVSHESLTLSDDRLMCNVMPHHRYADMPLAIGAALPADYRVLSRGVAETVLGRSDTPQPVRGAALCLIEAQRLWAQLEAVPGTE